MGALIKRRTVRKGHKKRQGTTEPINASPWLFVLLIIFAVAIVVLAGVYWSNSNMSIKTASIGGNQTSDTTLTQPSNANVGTNVDSSAVMPVTAGISQAGIITPTFPTDPKELGTVYLPSPGSVPISTGSYETNVTAYDSGNGYLYVLVTNEAGGTTSVAVINGVQLVTLIPLPPTACNNNAFSLGYDSGDGYVYVGCGSTIEVISGTSITTSISISHGAPYWAVYNPSNGYMYMGQPGAVYIISGTSLVTTNTAGGYLAAYDSSNGDVYMSGGGMGNINVYSGTSLSSISLPNYVYGSSNYGPAVYGLGYNPSNGYVYAVINPAGIGYPGLMDIINGLSVISSSIYVNTWANSGNSNQRESYYYVVYDAANNDMYISAAPNGYDGSSAISILSGTSLVENMTGTFYGLTYDPATGYIYTGNGNGKAVIAIQGETEIGGVFIGTDTNTPYYAVSLLTSNPSNGDVYVISYEGDVYNQGGNNDGVTVIGS